MTKTWLDLLGGLPQGARVDGRYIVRDSGMTQRVLWSFDDDVMAEKCFEQWLKEIKVFPHQDILNAWLDYRRENKYETSVDPALFVAGYQAGYSDLAKDY